jgi:FkbM family methyltransferase
MLESVFCCPWDCLPSIAEVWNGQYWCADALPPHVTMPTILDIGANVGAFSLWAKTKYRNATVYCYEPNPQTYAFLEQNLRNVVGIVPRGTAVGDPELTRLRAGKDTRLCASQYQLGRQEEPSIPVEVLIPENLPVANIVKIDAEGAEGYIVEHMKFTPDYLVVEYHSEDLLKRVSKAMLDRGVPVFSIERHDQIGIAKWVKHRASKPQAPPEPPTVSGLPHTPSALNRLLQPTPQENTAGEAAFCWGNRIGEQPRKDNP